MAVATAGRRPSVATWRCARPAASALVYVSCCEATLASDLSILLAGEDGFVVADGKRFDHFAGTGHVGGALLLLRRPRSLVLPVGPSCSGKSTLCAQLASCLPDGTAELIERDAVMAAQRAVVGGGGGDGGGGGGLGAAKRRTHQQMVSLHPSAISHNLPVTSP